MAPRDRALLGDPARGLRAVLFDFGGVLTTGPFEAFANYEQRNGLPEGFIRSLNTANHDDNAWARLERSEIAVDEFVVAFEKEAAAAGERIDGMAVLSLLAGELRPAMLQAVRACRERYLVGLLTNNYLTEQSASDPGGALDEVLALFDEVVESSKIGVRKPEPAFFEIACRRLGIEPSEAIFLDDLGVNLKPARAMGMRTIKVGDEREALAELSELAGLVLT